MTSNILFVLLALAFLAVSAQARVTPLQNWDGGGPKFGSSGQKNCSDLCPGYIPAYPNCPEGKVAHRCPASGCSDYYKCM